MITMGSKHVGAHELAPLLPGPWEFPKAAGRLVYRGFSERPRSGTSEGHILLYQRYGT